MAEHGAEPPAPGEMVVVGFDASPDAVRALSWAADLARTRNLGLEVCIARGDLHRLSRWADEWTAGLAREWEKSARETLDRWPDLAATVVIVDANPVPTLINRSGPTTTLVLGSRGRGRFEALLLGSVTQQVTRHAAGPVVVVRAPTDENSTTIVVGMDGSPEGVGALEWAARLAAARHADVQVLHSPEPALPREDDGHFEIIDNLPDELRSLEEGVRNAVLEARGRYPDVPIELELSAEDPRAALRHASNRAGLVVVGSRGRNAFVGMLLGSVSESVLARAHCPVVVVR